LLIQYSIHGRLQESSKTGMKSNGSKLVFSINMARFFLIKGDKYTQRTSH
jgi:hypothetical protein